MNRKEFINGVSAAGILLATGCSDGRDNVAATANKENKSMTFNELIEARRSVRRYAKSTIAQSEMETIVTEALNAPSWKNTETTRYYAAIGAEARERIRKEALPSFNAASSENAAALVAVTFVPGESGYLNGSPSDELGNMWGAYDCGLSSSYFVLAAKNHGWDSLIMGIRDVAKIKAIFDIPEKEILLSVIAVGKSAQKYMKVPRKPVGEVLKVL
ncbi:MAG: nitroreductase family protein [Kiritimatiellae bacterium]|nr:nitroreductase family protein [Kiritimatiellia bacterium]